MKGLFIDAGHGLSPKGQPDPGVSGNGTTEREQTVAIAKALRTLLLGFPLEIVCVSVDEALSIGDHIREVNNVCREKGWGPNDALFVSIHMNAGAPGARGVEAWYGMKKTSDLAVPVAAAVARATRMPLRTPEVIPSNLNRLGRLGVLDDTLPANACLVECGFLSDAQDAQIVSGDPAAVARGIAQGISGFLNLPLPAPHPATTYTDVPATAPYHDAVDACVKAGIFVPPADGLFRPDQPCTRAEVAVMFARLLASKS